MKLSKLTILFILPVMIFTIPGCGEAVMEVVLPALTPSWMAASIPSFRRMKE
jgi:hypothetical protein